MLSLDITKLFSRSRARAPSPRHYLKLYKSDAFLVDSVADFVAEGMRRNEAAVLIATTPHLQAITHALKQRGLPASRAIVGGQLVLLDAAATLNTFCTGGKIHRERFFDAFIPLFDQLQRAGHPEIRVYGEMVGLLWNAGHKESTIQLEALWNEMAETYSISLLCGYNRGSFEETGQSEGFRSICQAHGSTLPQNSQEPDVNLWIH